jgi:hypothetical protein
MLYVKRLCWVWKGVSAPCAVLLGLVVLMSRWFRGGEILKSFAALVKALSLKRSPKLKFFLGDVSEARTRWAAPQSRKGSWAENGKTKNAAEMHHWCVNRPMHTHKSFNFHKSFAR